MVYERKIKTTCVAYRLGSRMDKVKIDGKSLSEQSGISQSSISNYLNSHSEPTRNTAERLGRVLGVSADWILGVVPFDTEFYHDLGSSVDELLGLYKELSEKNRLLLIGTAGMLLKAQKYDAMNDRKEKKSDG